MCTWQPTLLHQVSSQPGKSQSTTGCAVMGPATLAALYLRAMIKLCGKSTIIVNESECLQPALRATDVPAKLCRDGELVSISWSIFVSPVL